MTSLKFHPLVTAILLTGVCSSVTVSAANSLDYWGNTISTDRNGDKYLYAHQSIRNQYYDNEDINNPLPTEQHRLDQFKEVHVQVTDQIIWGTWAKRSSARNTDFYFISDEQNIAESVLCLGSWAPRFRANRLDITLNNAYKGDAIQFYYGHGSNWPEHDIKPEWGQPHVTANELNITISSSTSNNYGARINNSNFKDPNYPSKGPLPTHSYLWVKKKTSIKMLNGGTALFSGIAPRDFTNASEKGLRNFQTSYIHLSGKTNLELGKDGFVGEKNSFYYDAGIFANLNASITVEDLDIQSYGSGQRDVYGILVGQHLKRQSPEEWKTEVIVNGALNINMYPEKKGAGRIFALKTKQGSIRINRMQADKEIRIIGNMDNEEGLIIANFMTNTSTFDGKVITGENATTNLFFANGAQWTVGENSCLTDLTLQRSTLVMNHEKDHPYAKITTQNLTTENATLIAHIDLGKDSASTIANHQIRVQGIAKGTLTTSVIFDGIPTDANKDHSEQWLISQGENSSLTVKAPEGGNQFVANGSLQWWSMKFVEQGKSLADLTPEDLLTLPEEGTGAGQWYLVKTDSQAETPEQGAIEDLGSTVAQAIGWMSEKNDLRRRLGEVRYGSQAGAWAKVFTRQDRAEGFRNNGFKQESSGIHVGYDTIVHQDQENTFLVGATFRYAHSDQEGIATAFGGDGDLNEYSAKIYGTWMHAKGSYMDVLAQVGYYDESITGRNNAADGAFDAKYHNWGFGVSGEIGHMFTLARQTSEHWTNHWFIEPQVELSYFHVTGDKFTTTTGLTIDQDNADFLTGRLGFVVGKKVTYADQRWYQLGVIGGISHEFLGDQSLTFTGRDGASARVDGRGLSGTTYYYGITADWQVSDRVRLYGELDRTEGSNYTKDYGINIGFKYAF